MIDFDTAIKRLEDLKEKCEKSLAEYNTELENIKKMRSESKYLVEIWKK